MTGDVFFYAEMESTTDFLHLNFSVTDLINYTRFTCPVDYISQVP